MFDNLNVPTLSYLITPSRLFLPTHSVGEAGDERNPNKTLKNKTLTASSSRLRSEPECYIKLPAFDRGIRSVLKINDTFSTVIIRDIIVSAMQCMKFHFHDNNIIPSPCLAGWLTRLETPNLYFGNPRERIRHGPSVEQRFVFN